VVRLYYFVTEFSVLMFGSLWGHVGMLRAFLFFVHCLKHVCCLERRFVVFSFLLFSVFVWLGKIYLMVDYNCILLGQICGGLRGEGTGDRKVTFLGYMGSVVGDGSLLSE